VRESVPGPAASRTRALLGRPDIEKPEADRPSGWVQGQVWSVKNPAVAGDAASGGESDVRAVMSVRRDVSPSDGSPRVHAAASPVMFIFEEV